MKKLFSKILFSIGLLIFLQNQALAQNIFDELKKAGEQLQKEIDKPDAKQKSPASGAQQPVTPKSPSAAQPSTPKAPVASSNIPPKNFALFGVKIGDQIANVKTDNKAFTKDSDNPFFMVGAHVLFTPTVKNTLFEQYVLSYGPISKKIYKVSGKLNKEYKTNDSCIKDFKDIYMFVAEKNRDENKEATKKIMDINGPLFPSMNDGYQVLFELKEKVTKGRFKDSNNSIGLDARCIKYANDKFIGWLELKDHAEEDNAKTELADLKVQKEKKDFEQKKDSGKLKGL